MQTQCPHCRAVFRVSAGQLRAARGEVRCGGCLLSFDAIPYLEDEPAEFDPPLPSSGETPAQEAVPEILREDLDRFGVESECAEPRWRSPSQT